MVQANPDASLWLWRSCLQEERLLGDRGDQRPLGLLLGAFAWRGGACGSPRAEPSGRRGGALGCGLDGGWGRALAHESFRTAPRVEAYGGPRLAGPVREGFGAGLQSAGAVHGTTGKGKG